MNMPKYRHLHRPMRTPFLSEEVLKCLVTSVETVLGWAVSQQDFRALRDFPLKQVSYRREKECPISKWWYP